jgi:hypothetical protein
MGWVNISYSQHIRLKEATRQGWAGGVCCVHGTNFSFSFLVSKKGRSSFSLDTLWTDGYCHPIAGIDQKMKFEKDTTIHLYPKISFNDAYIYYPDKDISLNKQCYDPLKHGCLLIYRIDKKRYEMDLTPYVKELMFIAYP